MRKQIHVLLLLCLFLLCCFTSTGSDDDDDDDENEDRLAAEAAAARDKKARLAAEDAADEARFAAEAAAALGDADGRSGYDEWTLDDADGRSEATEATCRSTFGDGKSCSDGSAIKEREASLSTFLLADDNIQIQLASVLPKRLLSKPLQSASPVAAAQLSSFGQSALLIAVMTFDGRLQCFRGSHGSSTSLEQLDVNGKTFKLDERKSKVTAIATIRSESYDGATFLGLGDSSGFVNIWKLRDEAILQREHLAALQVSHHGWEAVNHICISADGQMVVGSTADNIMLWHLPRDGEPQELRHLHGGDLQLSAASVYSDSSVGVGASGVGGVGGVGGGVGGGGPGRSTLAIAAVAFQSGLFEGWSVKINEEGGADAGSLRTIWKLPRLGEARIVEISIFPGESSQFLIATGDAEGKVSVWRFALNSFSQSAISNDSPLLWAKQLSSEGSAISGTKLLPGGKTRSRNPTPLLAVSVGQQVSVLNALTGEELHKDSYMSSIMALSW
eukprot:TRINITY_DN15458_c1_g2_i1.p1 TRINITY_DN15458_c1_g2~~TRINITY_DN15458_c1_g2_i1.p1  ORF type:complete len:503 (+),score=112.53 TRINITY_DN15458_c1_g2_i1:21-1529(+)